MKIHHIAIWVKDLEEIKNFYETYFQGKSNELYHNPIKKFSSYFLTFDSGCQIELMHRPDILEGKRSFESQEIGIVHLAFSVGSKEKVDELTEKLRADGYKVVSEPRITGDGYYESVILDPEENIIEIID